MKDIDMAVFTRITHRIPASEGFEYGDRPILVLEPVNTTQKLSKINRFRQKKSYKFSFNCYSTSFNMGKRGKNELSVL